MCALKFYMIFITVIHFSYGEKNKTTIMKCCQLNGYVASRGICNKTNGPSHFDGVIIFDKDITKTNKRVRDIFELVPASSRNFTKRRIVSTVYNYYLIEDGSIMLELPNTYDRWTHYNASQFCIDNALPRGKPQLEVRVWVALPEGKAKTRHNNAVFFVIVTELLVSSVFMVLVLVVYCLLPELRNLCGMILMAYVASMLGAFLVLATLNILYLAGLVGRMICRVFTFLDYYFFLSSFCWMNVMSLDIWWTFRGYAKARPIHRCGEKFKFGMYCLYAWGLPLAMTIGMGLIDQMDLTDKPWFIKPNLDRSGCFLEGGGKFFYLYVPMLIMIVMNWALFLMTLFNIWRLNRGTAVLDSPFGNSSAQRTHRRRFIVYLKLSVIMGVSWVLEVISSLSPQYRVWYLTDIYNLLVGVAIFFIFVCKKRIFKKLKMRICSERTKWSPIPKSRSTSISSEPDTIQDNSSICTSPTGDKFIVPKIAAS